MRTLAIVYEDPTLEELKVLAELDDAADEEQIRDQVSACGPLLRIYEDSDWGDRGSFRVTFIHSVAKEALLREKSTRKLIGLSDDSNDETELQWQHGILALRCYSYTINELDVDEDTITWAQNETEPVDNKTQELALEIKELFPENGDVEGEEEEITSLEYPTKFWLRHGYQATPDFVDTLDLKDAFWALNSTIRRRWWNSLGEGVEKLTAMHVAAFFGLTPLIDSLLAHGHESEIHVRDSWDNQ